MKTVTTKTGTRTVHDSLGELEVPLNALWGAQTQRAVDNFPMSGLTMPKAFIDALMVIKKTAAAVNQALGELDQPQANAIQQAAQQVIDDKRYDAFPVDVFQTGSGTSSNMNANEVIATLASDASGLTIHPNDHVNKSQSSNDVIPTAMQVSAAFQIHTALLPAISALAATCYELAEKHAHIVKTGRTHLMDAMPVSFAQVFKTWGDVLTEGIGRIQLAQSQLHQLAQGGTAVGTGVNAPAEFSEHFSKALSEVEPGLTFSVAPNLFARMGHQEVISMMSAAVRSVAQSLNKISNDLRWMNSGPLAGLAEVTLPTLQPGSSIMPGKVNPVIPEAVAMVAVQVMGNDQTISMAAQSGNFELNVMLPVMAYNLLQSIELTTNACQLLNEKCIAGITINTDRIEQALSRNPILVTALNERIGYELGAKIAKAAYASGRPVFEVAAEMTDISEVELKDLLDPKRLI